MLYIGIQIHIIRYKDKIQGGVDMGLKQRLTAVGELPWKHSVITINDGCDLCAENCTAVVGCTGGDASSEIVLKIRCNGTDRLIRVCGGDLLLESFGAYGVRITGNISGINFIEL